MTERIGIDVLRIVFLMVLIKLFICAFLLISTATTPDSGLVSQNADNVEDQISILNERLDIIEAENTDRYSRLSAELDRDFSWLGIVVAVFSLLIGIVFPLFFNSEQRQRFESILIANRKEFEERVSDLNTKLDSFSSEYAQFKKDYRVSVLLDAALDSDDVDERLSLLSEVLSIDSENQTALLRRGVEYRAKGYFLEAIADLQKLISINPNSLLAFSNIGYTYYRAKDYAHAMEYYDKALSINPVYSTVLFRISLVDYALGDYSQALEHINRAIEEKPDSISYHMRKKLILKRMQPRDDKAIEKEEKTIEQLREQAH